MVQEGVNRLPEGILYDAISETRHCLPDAVQLLTHCTTSNGWLKVMDLVTGTEVFLGLVEDRFIPIIQNKVESYGCRVVKADVVPDEREAIGRGVEALLAAGARLVVTTAGLSVDPDDVTRLGLQDAGATDMRYGAPILPGAMTLLARIGAVRIIGVPACALYFKRTSFDLLLPRLLAGLDITRRDLARMANGSLCLE